MKLRHPDIQVFKLLKSGLSSVSNKISHANLDAVIQL